MDFSNISLGDISISKKSPSSSSNDDKFSKLQAEIQGQSTESIWKSLPYQTHDFTSINYENLFSDLQADGVVVIKNVYEKNYCDNLMDRTLDNFEKLGSGVSRKNLKKTWTDENLPCQTRFGLFQSILGHIEPVWEVRRDEKIKKIFEEMYLSGQNFTTSTTKQESTLPLTVSIDAINIQPYNVGPLSKINTDPDWAHLDQTIRNEPYKCIQGSVTLTNTTAGFRCSPKSHLVHEEILDLHNFPKNATKTNNWCKLKNEHLNECKNLIENKAGGQYQIPIIVPAGSLILWYSSVVHSAIGKSQYERKSSADKYLGWRGVFYICYRPTEEFTDKQLARRKENIEKNRSMNHWCTNTFSTQSNMKFKFKIRKNCHENIEKLVERPELYYEMSGWRPDASW